MEHDHNRTSRAFVMKHSKILCGLSRVHGRNLISEFPQVEEHMPTQNRQKGCFWASLAFSRRNRKSKQIRNSPFCVRHKTLKLQNRFQKYHRSDNSQATYLNSKRNTARLQVVISCVGVQGLEHVLASSDCRPKASSNQKNTNLPSVRLCANCLQTEI